MKCKCSDLIFKQGLRQCESSCWFDSLVTGLLLNRQLRRLFKPLLNFDLDICSNTSCDKRRQYLKSLISEIGDADLDQGHKTFLLWYNLIISWAVARQRFALYIINYGGDDHLKAMQQGKAELVAVLNPHSEDATRTMEKELDLPYYPKKFIEITTSYPLRQGKYKLQMISVSTGFHVFSIIKCSEAKKWIQYDNESHLKGLYIKDDESIRLHTNLVYEYGYTVCIYTK